MKGRTTIGVGFGMLSKVHGALATGEASSQKAVVNSFVFMTKQSP